MKALFLLLMPLVLSAAEITKTCIADTFVDGMGNTLPGYFILTPDMTWRLSSTGETIAPKPIRVSVGMNGQFRVCVIPTDTIIGTGHYYNVSYSIGLQAATAVSWSKVWIVATSASDVKIGAVEADPPAGAAVSVTASQVVNVPYGNVSSTNVQSAINELDDAITAGAGTPDAVTSTLQWDTTEVVPVTDGASGRKVKKSAVKVVGATLNGLQVPGELQTGNADSPTPWALSVREGTAPAAPTGAYTHALYVDGTSHFINYKLANNSVKVLLSMGTSDSGIVKVTSGLPSLATAGTDYSAPGTNETTSGNRVFTGSVDATGATSSAPFRSGLVAAKPATCTVGQIYFATDSTAGQNLWMCTATDTWTQQVSGSGAPDQTVSAGVGFVHPFGFASGTVSSSVGAANTVAAWQMPQITATVDRVTVRIGTGTTGGKIRVAIYSSAGALVGQTADINTEGESDHTVIGTFSATLNLNGVYYIAITTNDANIALRKVGSAGEILSANALGSAYGWCANVSSSLVFPATCGTFTVKNDMYGIPPMVVLGR